MSDDDERIEVVIDTVIVASGEAMSADGATSPVVWLEGEGRRMHATDERVSVQAFLTIEEAEALGVNVIKETALLDLSMRLPIVEGPEDG